MPSCCKNIYFHIGNVFFPKLPCNDDIKAMKPTQDVQTVMTYKPSACVKYFFFWHSTETNYSDLKTTFNRIKIEPIHVSVIERYMS